MENQKPKTIPEKIDVIQTQLNRICYHLLNDDGAGKIGLIKKVEIINDRVEELENDKRVKQASIAIWGSVAGGGVVIIEKLLTYVLRHV